MKKTPTKLQLKKHTIVQLTVHDLTVVAGGDRSTIFGCASFLCTLRPSQCPTHCF